MAFMSSPPTLRLVHYASRIALTRASGPAYRPRHIPPRCAETPLPTKRSLPAPQPNFFHSSSLSRAPPQSYPTDIDALLQTVSPSDRFLPIWRDKPIVSPLDPSRTAHLLPVYWTRTDLQTWLTRTRGEAPSHAPLAAFLAHAESPSVAYFAVDVSQSAEPPLRTGEQAYALRGAVGRLRTEAEAALMAHGKALLAWHAGTGFCCRCGGRTVATRAGAARKCPHDACPARNLYPRIMPSVLALVLSQDGSRVLLGRQAAWPAGRYSVLAGFAEIFESLEETVVREVREETGVAVDRATVVYHSSQPWPSSPHASLMSGFRAHVSREEDAIVRVDEDELEDAQWFDKRWLRENLDDGDGSGEISIPGPTSLARRLISEWLDEPDSIERAASNS